MDKRTALTYIDSDGNWHRASKGAPEQVCVLFHEEINVVLDLIIYLIFLFHLNQILTLCNCKEDLRKKVFSVIDKFAERGLRSLGVARQVRNDNNFDTPYAFRLSSHDHDLILKYLFRSYLLNQNVFAFPASAREI